MLDASVKRTTGGLSRKNGLVVSWILLIQVLSTQKKLGSQGVAGGTDNGIEGFQGEDYGYGGEEVVSMYHEKARAEIEGYAAAAYEDSMIAVFRLWFWDEALFKNRCVRFEPQSNQNGM